MAIQGFKKAGQVATVSGNKQQALLATKTPSRRHPMRTTSLSSAHVHILAQGRSPRIPAWKRSAPCGLTEQGSIYTVIYQLLTENPSAPQTTAATSPPPPTLPPPSPPPATPLTIATINHHHDRYLKPVVGFATFAGLWPASAHTRACSCGETRERSAGTCCGSLRQKSARSALSHSLSLSLSFSRSLSLSLSLSFFRQGYGIGVLPPLSLALSLSLSRTQRSVSRAVV